MKVTKLGSALVVPLPDDVVEGLRLSDGDDVRVIASGDEAILIQRADPDPDAALARMAARHWPIESAPPFDRQEAIQR